MRACDGARANGAWKRCDVPSLDAPLGAAAAAAMGDDVDALNALLAKYREHDALVRVRAAHVIPDGTHRASTGVSLEHAHGIALQIATKGYDDDHDVPVVVRENVHALMSSEAYARWCAFVRANARVLPPVDATNWTDGFTTLGSSHLCLALKLIEHDTPSVFANGVPFLSYGAAMSRDARVREAIEVGLPSVVLRGDTPEVDRRRISVILNRANESGFKLDRTTGIAIRDDSHVASDAGALTVFEALSRTLDSEELSSLARIKFGLSLDASQRGYDDVGDGHGAGTNGAPRARL